MSCSRTLENTEALHIKVTMASLDAKEIPQQQLLLGHMSHTSANLLDSGNWKHMESMKLTALECMKKEIGNGHDTLLWSEPWVKVVRLMELVNHNIPHMTDTYNGK